LGEGEGARLVRFVDDRRQEAQWADGRLGVPDPLVGGVPSALLRGGPGPTVADACAWEEKGNKTGKKEQKKKKSILRPVQASGPSSARSRAGRRDRRRDASAAMLVVASETQTECVQRH
jgi:hypothetical protein